MIKAQLMNGAEGQSIQFEISAEAAADLAFIANDFVRAVPADSPEAERMIQLASMLSGRILDCLAARAGLALPASAMNLVPEFDVEAKARDLGLVDADAA